MSEYYSFVVKKVQILLFEKKLLLILAAKLHYKYMLF